MINEINKIVEHLGNDVAIDSHLLKDGLYIYFNDSGVIETLSVDKKIDRHSARYTLFKERDYYSNLLDMNKPVDQKKKIHSNNFYTLFAKADVFCDLILEDRIEVYFENLADPFVRYEKDKKALELLEPLRPALKDEARQGRIAEVKRALLKHLQTARAYLEEEAYQRIRDKKLYVKLFFEASQEAYCEEALTHFKLNIFNVNAYNRFKHGTFYGLSNANMGLNAKKPYLELKTKRHKAPFFLPIDKALQTKTFFDWLDKREAKGEVRFYHDQEENLLVLYKRGTGVDVVDFENLSLKSDKKDKSEQTLLAEPFYFNRVISYEYAVSGEAHSYEDFATLLDTYLTNKQLIFNYSSSEIKTSKFCSTELQNILYMSRSGWERFFRRHDASSVVNVINHYGLRLVIDNFLSIEYGSFTKGCNALNFYFSLCEYFNLKERVVDIAAMKQEMITRLDHNDESPLSDQMFFFWAGQMSYYLLQQSEKDKKHHSLVEPFMRVKNSKRLQMVLSDTFMRYQHALPFGAKKFNGVFALLMAYESEALMREHQAAFLAGYFADNLFYKKDEEKK